MSNPWNEPEFSGTNQQSDISASHNTPQTTEKESREWRLIEKTFDGLFKEQRRARRWGIFFKLLTFSYLFLIMILVVAGNELPEDSLNQPHTAIIEIKGAISADSEANADSIIWSLRRAFDAEQAKAVILRINSPGGSPVQSGYIYDEIKRLRELNPDKSLYAVITDIGASGAYYIASAADQVYADKASLVGSIGVVAGGFGFVELMEKVGVERRLYTSGEHKAFLDPFSPQNAKETELWQQVLDTTHRQFIDQVKKGRGDRLSEEPKLFSGLVWTGEQALELGLIDGLGSSSKVAREVVKVDDLVDYSRQPAPWQQVVEQLGVSFANQMAAKFGFDTSAPLR